MACVATGKIKEVGGLREALEIIRSKPIPEGILRILSKDASGRIGVRGGRFLIGAHVTSSGLTGYAALKSFLSLKRGMYYYLEGEEAGGLADLEQSLGVEVEGLLAANGTGDVFQQFAMLAQVNGWDCVTEVIAQPQPQPAQPPDQPQPAEAGQQFGDNFLDKIAWTARSTLQRLASLSKKASNESAARVFQDLENALSRSRGIPVSPDGVRQSGTRPVEQYQGQSWAQQAAAPQSAEADAQQMAAQFAAIQQEMNQQNVQSYAQPQSAAQNWAPQPQNYQQELPVPGQEWLAGAQGQNWQVPAQPEQNRQAPPQQPQGWGTQQQGQGIEAPEEQTMQMMPMGWQAPAAAPSWPVAPEEQTMQMPPDISNRQTAQQGQNFQPAPQPTNSQGTAPGQNWQAPPQPAQSWQAPPQPGQNWQGSPQAPNQQPPAQPGWQAPPQPGQNWQAPPSQWQAQPQPTNMQPAAPGQNWQLPPQPAQPEQNWQAPAQPQQGQNRQAPPQSPQAAQNWQAPAQPSNGQPAAPPQNWQMPSQPVQSAPNWQASAQPQQAQAAPFPAPVAGDNGAAGSFHDWPKEQSQPAAAWPPTPDVWLPPGGPSVHTADNPGGRVIAMPGSVSPGDHILPVDARYSVSQPQPAKTARPEEVVRPSNKQFPMSPRATDDRIRATTERTTESQRLRMIDIDEALANDEESEKVLKSNRKMDLASIGGIFVAVCVVVLTGLIIKTVVDMNSGDEFVLRAKNYTQSGRLDLAINEYTFALDKKHGDSKLLTMRAQTYETMKDYDHAKEDYDTIVQNHRDDSAASIAAATIRCRLNEYKDIIPITDQALTHDPKNDTLLALNGIALAATGEYDKALLSMGKIHNEASLTPYIAGLANGARGYCYLNQKQPEKALKYYQVAIKLQPSNDGLHRESAQCYEQLNDYKNAVSELQEAIKVAPSSAWNYMELAKLYDTKHDYANAIKEYRDAIKLSPHPLELYIKMAHDELQAGQLAEAMAACDVVSQMSPGNRDAVQIRVAAEQREKSAKPIAVPGLADLHAQDTSGLVAKGTAAMQHRQYASAVQCFRKAANIDPEDADVKRLLAYAYLRSGNKLAAYDLFVWLDANHRLPLGDKIAFADLAQACGHSERTLTIYSDCIEQKPDWIEARVRLIRACIDAGLNERATAVGQEGIIRAHSMAEKEQYRAAMNSRPRRR